MSTKRSVNFKECLIKCLGVAILLGCLHAKVAAQQPVFNIRVVPDKARIAVEGRGAPASTWSFRDTYAGVIGLGRRIEGFTAFDDNGKEIEVRPLAPGHFDSKTQSRHIRYEINLSASVGPSNSASVSWLTRERGLLMPSDLIPVFPGDGKNVPGVTINFALPLGWSVYANEAESQMVQFELRNVNDAVFAIGARLRVTKTNESGISLNLIGDGDWAFTDREGIDLAIQVLRAHRETFGGMPGKSATLILLPFPQAAGPSQWAAETRGSTVVLLLGKLPSKNAALAQLSTPLTHELLHLWVPNGLGLNGDYDWFYEGFSIYEAARTAVRLGLLTFPEFLNAIARAYDGYLSNNDRDRLSLVEASARRWTVGQSSVYSKSMVVAFVYDLQLRRDTRRKKTLETIYHRLFQDRGRLQAIDGNAAVLSALSSEGSMKTLVDSKISSPAQIDLKSELATFGLFVENFGLRTRISVSEQLTRQQRELLKDLGYNDVVRAPRK